MKPLELAKKFIEEPIRADAERELALMAQECYLLGFHKASRVAFEKEMGIEGLFR